ncbi:hypothetical protein CCP2SC5_210012 [Azospirillaceae bacterium]
MGPGAVFPVMGTKGESIPYDPHDQERSPWTRRPGVIIVPPVSEDEFSTLYSLPSLQSIDIPEENSVYRAVDVCQQSSETTTAQPKQQTKAISHFSETELEILYLTTPKPKQKQKVEIKPRFSETEMAVLCSIPPLRSVDSSEENAQQRELHKTLQKNIEEVKEEFSHRCDDLTRVQADYARELQILDNLNSDISKQLEEIQKNEERLIGMREELAALRQIQTETDIWRKRSIEAQEKAKELQAVEADLARRCEEKAALQQELAEKTAFTHVEVETMNRRLGEALATLRQIQAETDVWRQRSIEAQEKAKELQAVEADLARCLEEKSALQKELDEKNALRRELTVTHAEIETMNRQLRHVVEETINAQANYTQARHVLDGLSKEISSQEEERRRGEEQLVDMREELARFRQIQAETELWRQRLNESQEKVRELDRRQHELKDVEGELVLRYGEKASLQQILNETHAEIESARQKLRYLVEETTQAQADNTDVRKISHELKQEIATQRKEIQHNEEQCVGLRDELSVLRQVRAETEVWRRRLSEVKEKIEEFDQRRQELETINTEIVHCREEKSTLQKELDETRVELKMLNQQLRYVMEETDRVCLNHTQTRQGLDTLNQEILTAHNAFTETILSDLKKLNSKQSLIGKESNIECYVEATRQALSRFQSDLSTMQLQLERKGVETSSQGDRINDDADQLMRYIAAIQHLLIYLSEPLRNMERVSSDYVKSQSKINAPSIHRVSSGPKIATPLKSASDKPKPSASSVGEVRRQVPVEGMFVGMAGSVEQGVNSVLAITRGVGVTITSGVKSVLSKDEASKTARSKNDVRNSPSRRESQTMKPKPPGKTA